jgi:hypothetical protein
MIPDEFQDTFMRILVNLTAKQVETLFGELEYIELGLETLGIWQRYTEVYTGIHT